MSKSYSGSTVTLPKGYQEAEYQRRLDEHLNLYHFAHSCVEVRVEFLSEFLLALQEKLSEGRKLVIDEQHHAFSRNGFFKCYVTKLPEEVEADIEALKLKVEAEYKSEIVAELEAQKAILIEQRKAEIKAKEAKAVEEKERKLQAELEKEANEFFNPKDYGL